MRPSNGIMRALLLSATLLGWTVVDYSQDYNTSANNAQSGEKEDFKIRVGVEEVRLDAVVLDQKGHQITNLTSGDFEIFQDGKLQGITSSAYINDNQIQPGIGNLQSNDLKTVPRLFSRKLTQDAVRRTIVILVDDLSMTFTSVYRLRYGLRKFVETQMQPGDLVAILRTNAGESAHQTFASDKRQLLEMIDNIRWGFSVHGGLPQAMAIGYCIRALQDMPGRKYLILVSSQIATTGGNDDISAKALNGLADAALRAGVVVHTLDMLPLFSSDPEPLASGESSSESELINIRNMQRDLPLSRKTGGLFLTKYAWFLNALGDVNEEMKGYYLLTYVPPTNTFNPDNRGTYHKLSIAVKRPGCEVHHRDGFLGAPKGMDSAINHTNPLMEAMFSPFQRSDLVVHLISGFINDATKGYLVQTWLHLDGKELSFSEEDGKNSFISLNTTAVTTDTFGAIQDSGKMSYKIPIKNGEQISRIRDQGLTFFVEIPAKGPGSYYVRAAVQDRRSGKLGSAYQYIEIPDLKNGRLALSNIFLSNHDKHAPPAVVQTSRGRPVRNAALGSYLPGECIEYAAVIYNAKYKQQQPPDLESNVVLYREGVEVLRSKPQRVALNGVSDFRRIPLSGKLFLDTTTKPGEYELQLQIWDNQANGNQNFASRALSFEIPAE
jgi:VWFA-related protein